MFHETITEYLMADTPNWVCNAMHVDLYKNDIKITLRFANEIYIYIASYTRSYVTYNYDLSIYVVYVLYLNRPK